MIIPAITVPELNGSPIVLTKNISKALKKLNVLGISNLNINNKMAMETIIMNFFF